MISIKELKKNKTNIVDLSLYGLKNEEYEQIKIPIIYIVDLFGDNDSYIISKKLKQVFKKNKYNCEVLLIHNDYVVINEDENIININAEYRNHDIIRVLNKKINWIIKSKLIDVIIITSNEPILPTNISKPGDCSLMSFIISQTCPPDITILCSPLPDHISNLYLNIKECVLNKFNFNIKNIHISDKVVDLQAYENNGEILYCNVCKEKQNLIINSYNDYLKKSKELTFYDLTNDDRLNDFFNTLLKEFE